MRRGLRAVRRRQKCNGGGRGGAVAMLWLLAADGQINAKSNEQRATKSMGQPVG